MNEPVEISESFQAHQYQTEEKEMLDINSIIIENDVAFLFSTKFASWAKYSLPEFQNPTLTWLLRFECPIEESQYHHYDIESAFKRIRHANWLCMIFFVFSFMAQFEDLHEYVIPNACLILLMFGISVLPQKCAPKNSYYTRALLSGFVFFGTLYLLVNRYRLRFTLPPMSFVAVNLYVTGVQRLSFIQCALQITIYNLSLFVLSSLFADVFDVFAGALILLVHGLCMLALSRYLIRDMRVSFAKRMALLFERQRAKEEHRRIKKIANCIVPASMVDELCDLVAKEVGDTSHTARYYSSVRQYEDASFMFASITSPGLQSPNIDPTQMVCALSVFVHIVDNLCFKHNVDRIKSIGSTVLIVSGIPNHKHFHRRNLMSLGLELQKSVSSIQSKHPLLAHAHISIGIHTGPCLAGVIGLSQFSFDVWGDSINVTSRLLSTCEPGKIQVSGEIIRQEKGFYYEGRGEVYLKGKGNVQSYYLLEEYNDEPQRNQIIMSPITRAITTIEASQEISEVLRRELVTLSSNIITKRLKFRDESLEKEYKTLTTYHTRDMKFSMGVVIAIVIFFVLNDLIALNQKHLYTFLIIRIVGQFVPVCLTIAAVILVKNRPMRMHFIFLLLIIVTSASVLLKLYIVRQDIKTTIQAYGAPRSGEYALYFYSIELVSLSSVLFMLPRANFWSTVVTNAILFGIHQTIIMSMNKIFISNTFLSNFALFFLGVYICYSIELQRRYVFAFTRLLTIETESIDMQKLTTQRLILSVVPKQIYDRLTTNHSTFGARHTEIVSLFADVVGFTSLSGRISLSEMNELLNHIFITFDRLCLKYNLQKLKSLGDCVVVVGGVHHNMEIAEEKPSFESQIRSMLCLAEEAHAAAQRISLEIRQDVQFRIGIAVGSCVSGVIGSRKFNYDIWGEAITAANRMESSGIPGKTQVSERIYEESRSYIFYDVVTNEDEQKRYFMLSTK